jgi:hypothetical protein
MRLPLALVLACALAPLAGATEPAQTPLSGAVDIPPEEWSAMAAGRTLTYSIGGQFWALERYDAASDGVALEFRDGTCLEGRWEYVEPLYCFHWEGEGTSCFRHVRLGSEILILETEAGSATGAIQVMTGISSTPLACGTPRTS